MSSFPILMYHALWPAFVVAADRERYWAADVQLSDPGARLYAFDVNVFARQISILRQAGVQTPTAWDQLDAPRRPGQLWITFDDGHRSNAELALPVLQQNKLTAIFFITTDWIGQPGFMSPAQIRELRQAGMLIGAHGCSHQYFSDLPLEAVHREMRQSKARLEEILDEHVPALALPGGRSQPRIQQAAREAGYRHLFTSTIRLASPRENNLDWPRIPMTNRLPDDFLEKLVQDDDSAVRRMARTARLRQVAQRLLGNALYDRLRLLALRRRY